MGSAKPRAFLYVLILLGSALVLTQRFRVETDLFAFLPRAGVGQELDLTRSLLEGPLRRALVLNVVYDDEADAARDVARRLARDLADHPAIERVSTGPDESVPRAVFDLYFPRRFALAIPQDQPASKFWTRQGLGRRLEESKQFLATPAATLYRPLFSRDPLLLFRAQMERLRGLEPEGVRFEDGQFMTDGAAVVFVEVKDDLDSEQKSSLLTDLEGSFRRHRGQASLQLQMSGALPFEVEGEAITRQDVSRVSLISLGALTALCLVFFRGLLPLLLVLWPIVSGLLVGAALCILVFGEIHGLTLAFGAALIGVSMDYPLHLLSDQAFHGDSAKHALVRIKKGLFVGCATTSVGFLTFFLTQSPALLQVAVVTSAGLVTSLAVSVGLLPGLPIRVGSGAPQRLLAQNMNRLMAYLAPHHGAARGLVLVLLVGLALGLSRIEWRTSTAALNPTSQRLRDEDAAVRSRMHLDGPKLVVYGNKVEQLLERSFELSDKLETKKRLGVVQSYGSVSMLLPPRRLQEENARFAAREQSLEALRQALGDQGFKTDAFERALSEQRTPFSPLTLGELKNSPLRDAFEPLLVHAKGMHLGLTSLRAEPGVADQVAQETPHSFVYQPETFIEQALSTLGRSLRKVIIVGATLMLAIVFFRHRKWRPTLLAFLPAAIAASASLVWVSLLRGPLHLFHALAALVVLAMGIDYGTFLVEAQTEKTSAPWASIFGAALSTLASMGTLGLSSVPALEALGSVIFLGILLAVLVCLLLQVALPPLPQNPRPPGKGEDVAPLAVHPEGERGSTAAFFISRVRGAKLALSLSTVPLFFGCASNRTQFSPKRVAASETETERNVQPPRESLLPPAELPRLFWRQEIDVRYQKKRFSLDAVLQNDGESFDVLALGPAQTRVFLIRQTERGVTLQVFIDREIDIAPEWLLFDLQRALFFNAPRPLDPSPRPEASEGFPQEQKQTKHELNRFCVTDTWRDGAVVSRLVSDRKEGCDAPESETGLHVRYTPGWTPGMPPTRVDLSHPQRDYSITVRQVQTGALP